jgi:lysyl-tRNA synthetase class 2
MSDRPSDDFRPTAPWENLRLRAELLRRLREFFRQRGFLEVETPILSADTVVDRHLDPFAVAEAGEKGTVPICAKHPTTNLRSVPGSGKGGLSPFPTWLQTSPEFAMKRLLAAGAEAIYQVSRVFRQGEQGTLHNPEFTLVEWYRTGERLDEGIQRTSELCDALLGRGPAERTTYREAFLRHVGLDPHVAPVEDLMAAARQGRAPREAWLPPESLRPDDRDGWLDWLLTERVQMHLGQGRPLLLCDYPASQAALAEIRPGNPPVAERFELYVSGIELANGYHELRDAGELRKRIARANAQRVADGKPPLPESSRLLAAMEAGLPPAVGVALGFDRLVMLAAGAKTIAEVMAFPWDRA